MNSHEKEPSLADNVDNNAPITHPLNVSGINNDGKCRHLMLLPQAQLPKLPIRRLVSSRTNQSEDIPQKSKPKNYAAALEKGLPPPLPVGSIGVSSFNHRCSRICAIASHFLRASTVLYWRFEVPKPETQLASPVRMCRSGWAGTV